MTGFRRPASAPPSPRPAGASRFSQAQDGQGADQARGRSIFFGDVAHGLAPSAAGAPRPVAAMLQPGALNVDTWARDAARADL